MGANSFFDTAKGVTAKAAFQTAVKKAQHDYGHAGYTGTIAEKTEFVMLVPPEGSNPETWAETLVADGDDRIDDKWGPAGCVALGGNEYLFFGYASS